MTTYCVYKWSNNITRKAYIGYTSLGINERWKKHLLNATAGGDTYFYRSIRKYGASAFSGIVLFETDCFDLARQKEKEFIAFHNTINPVGYNVTRGGTGGNTYLVDPDKLERRLRLMSERNSGASNPNASGLLDDDIVRFAVTCYLEQGRWCNKKWAVITAQHRIPKHFVKSRFQEFGGGSKGFRAALKLKLETILGKEIDLTYKYTEDHRKNASASLKNRIWVTNTVTNKTYLAYPSELDKENMVKGRKNANN